MRAFIAAIAAAIVLSISSPSFADDCITPSTAIDLMQADGAQLFDQLEGDNLAPFIAALPPAPPNIDISGTVLIQIWITSTTNGVVLFFGDNGCHIANLSTSLDVLAKALGDPA